MHADACRFETDTDELHVFKAITGNARQRRKVGREKKEKLLISKKGVKYLINQHSDCTMMDHHEEDAGVKTPASPITRAQIEIPGTTRSMSLQQLKLANTVAFATTMLMNALSTTNTLSDADPAEQGQDTKIVPDGPAFSIWGIIYFLQALFVVYQICWPKDDESTLLHGVGLWFLSVSRPSFSSFLPSLRPSFRPFFLSLRPAVGP
jgi:hypothetical protein